MKSEEYIYNSHRYNSHNVFTAKVLTPLHNATLDPQAPKGEILFLQNPFEWNAHYS